MSNRSPNSRAGGCNVRLLFGDEVIQSAAHFQRQGFEAIAREINGCPRPVQPQRHKREQAIDDIQTPQRPRSQFAQQAMLSEHRVADRRVSSDFCRNAVQKTE